MSTFSADFGLGLLWWTYVMAVIATPLGVLIALAAGLRFRPPRRGLAEGALGYSVVAVFAPLVWLAIQH